MCREEILNKVTTEVNYRKMKMYYKFKTEKDNWWPRSWHARPLHAREMYLSKIFKRTSKTSPTQMCVGIEKER